MRNKKMFLFSFQLQFQFISMLFFWLLSKVGGEWTEIGWLEMIKFHNLQVYEQVEHAREFTKLENFWFKLS